MTALAWWPAFAGKPVGDDKFGALRAMQAPKEAPPALGVIFEPLDEEVVALLGGTNVVNSQFLGYFEALATLAWPKKKLRFRNLAWQADTVFRQQRPQYFFDAEHHDERPGSTHDERIRVQPTTIFVRFGKMESLDGMAALPRYREAFGVLLDELMKVSPRIVVVSPTPFFEAGPARALAEARNGVLVAYCLAMSELAEERGLFFADLYQFEPDRDYSEDGIHLNTVGHQAVARRLLLQLRGDQPTIDVSEELRQVVVKKSRVWYQYFRPTNWAFLYGDRQHVPSSRDHTDHEKRWFPTELSQALPLIDKLEAQIHEFPKAQ